ncbi:rRNA maturation RNase YbeY [Candidatus Nitronereus thalassa]|uniref:Endoribonuclease YbeY n=1 Tax=Candidatus Nitronereus thalassa TaxID=3020898 RepID=A0ABU3KAF6_9BACT|nr:rRNA maturation RNase YbeY [Candidatus Nitronereus thalassa]MDT7043396.1 rRNA maturation RNase YbeY [Candidatus Nitronereus thalassa]
MPVFVHSQVRRVVIQTAVVSRVVQKLLTLLGETASEVSIDFVGDARMRHLNRAYRRKDRTTDVLAFASREAGGPHSPMLGDVVVSVPAAMRQAKELGHALNQELARLLIHGLLHLVGYDHELGAKEAQRMRRKEEKLFAALKPLPKLVTC